jgi:hypothetical protein
VEAEAIDEPRGIVDFVEVAAGRASTLPSEQASPPFSFATGAGIGSALERCDQKTCENSELLTKAAMLGCRQPAFSSGEVKMPCPSTCQDRGGFLAQLLILSVRRGLPDPPGTTGPGQRHTAGDSISEGDNA